jgi:phosphate transport system protein
VSKHLERDMEYLHREILAVSALVEDMLDRVSRAMRTRNPELAASVIASDEEVDQREVRIEEECLKMLALHQPAAGVLRRIATVLKANADLERIADLAVNIAERAQCLAASTDFPVPRQLDHMFDLAIEMLQSALDAFVNLDATQARRIIRLDDQVDKLNEEIIVLLQEKMQESPAAVVPGLHFFSATRHVERIADHATNIAEDVIYLVEGEIARHKPEFILPTSDMLER